MTKKLLTSFLIILSICSSLLASADTLPEKCTRECVEPFGHKLGQSHSAVPAYSNCQNACVNPTPNFVAGVYTGIKWQCVEYARRWLLVNEGVVYGDVDIAADIWNLNTVSAPRSNTKFAFKGFVNGHKNLPQRGDLLIYSSEFLGTGHVAVVLRVESDHQQVLVGEQNFDNDPWPQQFARAIPYVQHNNGYWLLDPYIIGWKRVIYSR